MRYVPDVVAEEFVNIGMLLWSDGVFAARFITEYGRVVSLSPGDLDAALMVAAIEAEWRYRLSDRPPFPYTPMTEATLLDVVHGSQGMVQFSTVMRTRDDLATALRVLPPVYLSGALR